MGDFNLRWHHVYEHESDRLGPYVCGRGRGYLESKKRGNRKRWWDAMCDLDLVDGGSFVGVAGGRPSPFEILSFLEELHLHDFV